jgi:predicted nucleotidyltransferase component of viral defense system
MIPRNFIIEWRQHAPWISDAQVDQSEDNPPIPMKLKIEINNREHFSVNGFIHKNFKVNSSWFQGNAPILTYHLEELMGTKLRALFQRKKGRDLFDFWFILKHHQIDLQNVVKTFHHYLDKQGIQVSRAQFEQNLIEKASSHSFVDDIRALLSPEVEPHWSLEEGLKWYETNYFQIFLERLGRGAYHERKMAYILSGRHANTHIRNLLGKHNRIY